MISFSVRAWACFDFSQDTGGIGKGVCVRIAAATYIPGPQSDRQQQLRALHCCIGQVLQDFPQHPVLETLAKSDIFAKQTSHFTIISHNFLLRKLH